MNVAWPKNHDCFAESGRLWSLWDMLRVSAKDYIELGNRISEARQVLFMAGLAAKGTPESKLDDREKTELRNILGKMWDVCHALDLPIAGDLILARADNPPETAREYELLVDLVKAEIKNKLFLFVPAHRSKYYEKELPPLVGSAFPSASQEIISACNCFACGLSTASVFHSMRAAEMGIRTVAGSLDVNFEYPLDLAELGKVIEKIEEAIQVFKKPPKSAAKDTDLKFYSEALAQARHLNNGWRIRVSHARSTYEEGEAHKVIDHTMEFLRTLATRLTEMDP